MATLYKEVPHVVFESWHDQQFLERVVSAADSKVLRELAKKLAEIAAQPVNARRKEMWTGLNDLQDVKPMVWLNEVCWNEMDVADELRLRTASPFCQRIEAQLRQTIYQWEHMQGDMVVDPIIAVPLVVENSGLGLSFEEDILTTDEENEIVSHRFHIQIRNEEDIGKIKTPVVTYREDLTQESYDAYSSIFAGVLPVEKRGITGFWFAPWDDIIRLTGVQEAIMDLVLRSSYIHALVKRVVDVYLEALDQFERLNLLASNNTNTRIGSGAYGYTKALPPAESQRGPVQATDIWGAATAQIFAAVSPEMHEEFALAYERRWLDRFGLTYYGCCEPLDKKVGILRSIPNLRKISMSPWIDKEEAAEAIGADYVFSFKPSPVVLAKERWNPEEARQELVTMLRIAKKYGCRTEIIMKDISTVHYQPQRLWEWASIASEVTARYG